MMPPAWLKIVKTNVERGVVDGCSSVTGWRGSEKCNTIAYVEWEKDL